MNKIAFVFLSLFLSEATQVYADERTESQAALTMRAYEFMTQGWGGEAIRGYQATHDLNGFFHKIGKVKNETVQLIKRVDTPLVNNEYHTYQYEGMKVGVLLARYDHKEKVIVDDVVITSPNWPVKDGLGIGTTRMQIETAFGKSTGNNNANEWAYGDGLDDITYTFDKNNKAVSIHWHGMID
jgi:hypothetical protein